MFAVYDCVLYHIVCSIILCFVSYFVLYHIVCCIILFVVSYCVFYHIVCCITLCDVSYCVLYHIVCCTILFVLSYCVLYHIVCCIILCVVTYCFIFFCLYFVSLYVWLHDLSAFVKFFKLWIFIVMCMFYYCYVRMFRSVYSVSLCCSMYCLYVYVYCTTVTGCQPNCS
jgi:hypothetical protein